MRPRIVTILVVLAVLLGSALVGLCALAKESGRDKPERIVSKRIRILSPGDYGRLRGEWDAYTRRHPDDPVGWTELAKAARYAGATCEEYMDYAKKAVEVGPGYAEAHAALGCCLWKVWCPGSERDPDRGIAELEKALELDPENGEPHYSLWPMKLYQGDREAAEGHLKALLRSGTITEPLLDLAYNMLVGLEPDAILLTNGDNDTYPPLALQAARGFRRDVAILNLSLLNTVWYRKEMSGAPNRVPLPEIAEKAKGPQAPAAVLGLIENLRAQGGKRPLYAAVTCNFSYVDLPGELSLEGVVYRVFPDQEKGTSFNVERLEENLEEKYRLESATSLGFPWDDYPAIRSLLMNYVAAYSSLAGALAEVGEKERARPFMEAGLEMCEFHGFDEFGRNVALEWIGWDKGNRRAEGWRAKFAD